MAPTALAGAWPDRVSVRGRTRAGARAELASDVRLAFFIPGIVYMADAVGTQTETLVIRGLSVGVPISRVFRLESLTGVLVSCCSLHSPCPRYGSSWVPRLSRSR